MLSERGLEPRDAWLSVRLVKWPRERMYTVIIAYQPARVVLAGLLGRDMGSVKRNAVGVWVLDESEARDLCDGARP
jgi:hypothetical protein